MDYIYASISKFREYKCYEHLSPELWDWYLGELLRRGLLYRDTREHMFFIVYLPKSIPLFISKQMLEILGYTSQNVEEDPNNFFKNITYPDDMAFFSKMNKYIEPLLTKHYKHDKKPYFSVTFTVRMKHKNDNLIPFECNMYPMAMFEGRSVFSLVSVKIDDSFRQNTFQAYLLTDDVRYIYVPRADKLVLEDKIILKPLDHQILVMVAKGVREQSIAKKLNLDVNMVKYYKKNIMEKLSVYSMPQAVYYALRKGLI